MDDFDRKETPPLAVMAEAACAAISSPTQFVGVERFLRDASFRDKLVAAESLDDVFRAIEEEDAKF